MNELLESALSGQRRAVAQLISILENEEPGAREALARLYPRTGQARVIGITGAPGSGKSTLLFQMARAYRKRDMTVGVVAVDPTSPFSGGALLGDRIRMQALSGDNGVFLRSMASRGSLGGLAQAASRVIQALDACGYRRILVETVGAGQTEVDVARLAHTTVVIQVPGLGDDIQALKAGILEIADVLVVNKADLPGAEQTLATLRAMLGLSSGSTSAWQPPLVKTIATTGAGTPELIDAIERHVAYLVQSGQMQARERARAVRELEEALREELLRRARARWGEGRYRQAIERLAAHQVDPYTAAEELLNG
jgi:LAO/AO transport system kinase